MLQIAPQFDQLAWPLAIALTWVLGEFSHRLTGLPRISVYAIAGFVVGNAPFDFLPASESLALLAHVAFGLILFELGYRINLHWLRVNPWIAVTGVLEAVATFAAVYLVCIWFGMPSFASALLASLAMSTSPASIVRVVNDTRSSGQVTERIVHLSAINSVLAVFAFKVVVGIGMFRSSGVLFDAAWSSLAILAISAGLGALMGLLVPGLMRRLGRLGRDATVAFSLAVILLVAIAETFSLSPLLAALSFGLVARHRRVALSQAQRNFGAIGDLLTVMLFFFVAASLQWQQVSAHIGLALAIIAVRFVVKLAVVSLLARPSGISWRKGLLTGVALTPFSVFAILLLEQTTHTGLDLVRFLGPLAAMALLLEVLGPIVTQHAVQRARETHVSES